MSIFGAYLEDYHFIKIITHKNEKISNPTLENNNVYYNLNIYNDEYYGDEHHLYASFPGKINLSSDYIVTLNDKCKYNLTLGKITRTKRFDYENSTDEELGYFYSKQETTFKVWSPVAKEVKILIDDKEFNLKLTKRGVWVVTLKGDFANKEYLYKVRINDKFIKTLDPYGKCTTLNHKKNIVVDFDSCYQYKNDFIDLDLTNKQSDMVVCEINVRDLTSKMDIENPGSYKAAALSSNTNKGLGYLKTVGYTHLQLMPIFGFGGVNEEVKSQGSKFKYNWGYNPVSYFSPSNWFTSTLNPIDSINELKQLIDQIHTDNMGVVMDVVFNHVYDSATYSYANFVPGYFFRTDDRGFLTNTSGCGNDLATERSMTRKLIIDCLKFWQKEYKIDGFRFDLMNIIDIDTLNLAAKELRVGNKNNVCYGEGWNMPSVLPFDKSGCCENFWCLKDFAFFNDRFRDNMKSNFDLTAKGFLLGGLFSKDVLYSCLTGYSLNEERFGNPYQSINYVECHDNYTFYDVLKKLLPKITVEETKDRIILAIGCIILSAGMPFIHLGLPLLRSKKGNGNSYNSNDDINGVDWNKLENSKEITDCLREFVAIRKEYSCFRTGYTKELSKIVSIEEEFNSFALRYFDKLKKETIVVIFKNDFIEERMFLAPGNTLLFDGRNRVEKNIDELVLTKPGIYILRK